ncbi:MAG: HEAT repeat domain-containing protein, partial [Candidatus Thorarchaeota archaeon]
MSAPLKDLLRDAKVEIVVARAEKDPSVIKELIESLNSDIRSVRFNASLALGELGENAAEAVSHLVDCLDDDDWSICREASEATRSLGKIGESAVDAIPNLSKLLTNDEQTIRKAAAISLGKIGVATDEAISSLISALEDKDEEIRTEAVITLGKMGQSAHTSISNLIVCLKDTSWTVRTAAAQAIKGIGTRSVEAIPTLVGTLEDKDWRVRYRSIDTLAEIGDDAIPALIDALNHNNQIVRKGAVEALGEMRITDPDVLNSMAILLKDKVESVRGKAADALRTCGKESIPILTDAYDTSSKSMKILIIS